jgi:hypothetical protein
MHISFVVNYQFDVHNQYLNLTQKLNSKKYSKFQCTTNIQSRNTVPLHGSSIWYLPQVTYELD